jgi:hypothetical protein
MQDGLPIDLRTLLPLEDPRAVELFVGTELTRAGLWPSGRHSDGVDWLRALRYDAASVRLVGMIRTIEQAEHGFALDLEVQGRERVWLLRVDPEVRRVRLTLGFLESADDLAWRIRLAGGHP